MNIGYVIRYLGLELFELVFCILNLNFSQI